MSSVLVMEVTLPPASPPPYWASSLLSNCVVSLPGAGAGFGAAVWPRVAGGSSGGGPGLRSVEAGGQGWSASAAGLPSLRLSTSHWTLTMCGARCGMEASSRAVSGTTWHVSTLCTTWLTLSTSWVSRTPPANLSTLASWTWSDSLNPERKILQPSRKPPAFFTLPSSSSASQSAVVLPLMAATRPPASLLSAVELMVSSTLLAAIVSSGSRMVEHMETSASPATVWSCLVGVLALVLPRSTRYGSVGWQ